MSSLGEKLKQLRKEKKLTLTQLSELTGISQPYLSQIEADKKNPSAVYLHKLSDSLEVPYSSLIKLTGKADFIDKYNQQVLEQGQSERYVSKVVPIDTVRLEALEAATDLQLLLQQESITLLAENIRPSFNGHYLSKEESERALAMLHLLFPQYSNPPK